MFERFCGTSWKTTSGAEGRGNERREEEEEEDRCWFIAKSNSATLTELPRSELAKRRKELR